MLGGSDDPAQKRRTRPLESWVLRRTSLAPFVLASLADAHDADVKADATIRAFVAAAGELQPVSMRRLRSLIARASGVRAGWHGRCFRAGRRAGVRVIHARTGSR